MHYDKDCDLLKISVREFVSGARRMISTVPQRDEDEPEIIDGGRAVYKKLGLSDAKKSSLSYAFDLKDSRAELVSSALADEEGSLVFVCRTEKSPKKPNKTLLSEMRGIAFISALMLMESEGVEKIDTRIVFYSYPSFEISEIKECITKKSALAFFEKCKSGVEVFATPEIDRVKYRLPSMKTLAFPYENMREGQREFIERVYRSLSRQGRLFASAPTGTGKTVSTLYPAIKALGNEKIKKVFYFTHKRTTAIAAYDCIDLFVKNGAKIRAVSLYSKERLCKRGLLCRDDRGLCPASACNNMMAALIELYEAEVSVVCEELIGKVAQKHTVCPHELALAYSELCDVVILDVNYLFDPKVYIRRYFTEGGDFAFLIDEAHNLPDRAREIFSEEISEDMLINPVESEILGEFSEVKKLSLKLSVAFRAILYPYLKDELRFDENGNERAAVHIKEIPTKLFSLFAKSITIIENEIKDNLKSRDTEAKARLDFLKSYLYPIKNFYSAMHEFDSAYEMFIFLENGTIKLKLFCIDPGERIAKRLDMGKSAVFFSGTLSPINYYKSTLGGDGSSEVLEIDSPFDKGQISVSIMDKVSTRFSERENTMLAVSRIIAATVSAKRGNYMIFTPSFDYAELLYKVFTAKYPKIKTLIQKRDMTKSEKENFLKEFSNKDSSYLIGFCVMGGIYSEGIDLAGDALIGAVVVGLGLPSISFEREAIAAYYQEKFDEGREFAYIYPGMNRVLQAGGRVIRREDDRGVVVLVDDRFDDPIYRKLTPKLWSKFKFINDPKELNEELLKFWAQTDS